METAGQHPGVPERAATQAAAGEGSGRSDGRVGAAGQPRHRRSDAAALDERRRRGGRHGHFVGGTGQLDSWGSICNKTKMRKL